MIFTDLYKHLLPKARAWTITATKPLRSFFAGLDFTFFKAYTDDVWLDIFPQSTRELPAWENQFGILSTNFTEQERRDRLDAAWKETGGQSPRYIQDVLQARGFDVYVHDWWEHGDEPPVNTTLCPTVRNPFDFLREPNAPVGYITDCGEALMECGEAIAECGNRVDAPGFPLINNIEGITYTIPTDANKWPYFIYIGGATFPDLAAVDIGRREEFETLCLKICPLQNWIGLLINYS